MLEGEWGTEDRRHIPLGPSYSEQRRCEDEGGGHGVRDGETTSSKTTFVLFEGSDLLSLSKISSGSSSKPKRGLHFLMYLDYSVL